MIWFGHKPQKWSGLGVMAAEFHACSNVGQYVCLIKQHVGGIVRLSGRDYVQRLPVGCAVYEQERL